MEDPAITTPRPVAGFRAVLQAACTPTRWKLRSQPATYRVYWTVCVLTALGSTGYAALAVPTQTGDLVTLAALLLLGVGQAEAGREIERMRRIISVTPHINLTSVWIFAGVLLLPPVLTFALIALLYAHLAVRSWAGLPAAPLYRTVINVGNTSLASYVAYLVLDAGVGDIHGAMDRGWFSAWNVAAALALDFFTAAIIILPGLRPAKKTVLELAGGLADNVLEATTLGLGVVVALILAGPLPWAVVVTVPALVFIHRGVLYKQVEIIAGTDEKTGLFNTRGWVAEASEALTRAGEHGHGAVIMCDLDRFKRINDDYGHLAGDAVLKAVADVLKEHTRDYDRAARFGGEEFVVLLTDITTENAMAVAERIRRAVRQLRVHALAKTGHVERIKDLSVSIGVAPYPEVSGTLDVLVAAADTALLIAKERGRDQVCRAYAA